MRKTLILSLAILGMVFLAGCNMHNWKWDDESCILAGYDKPTEYSGQDTVKCRIDCSEIGINYKELEMLREHPEIDLKIEYIKEVCIEKEVFKKNYHKHKPIQRKEEIKVHKVIDLIESEDLIKLNTIWKNKVNGDFVHIKDVTHFNSLKKGVASIVTSKDTVYIGDSQTTVGRQVFDSKTFLSKYLYVTDVNDIGLRDTKK